MPTLYITHPACLNHLTPSGHPERPDRLRAIDRVLENERFQTLARVSAPEASIDDIALCHPRDFIEEIAEAVPKEGMVRIDADTSMPVLETGRFVKSPSIFLKKMEFSREYVLREGISIPQRMQSLVNTRLFGPVQMSVNFTNFARDNSEAGLVSGSPENQ